MAEGDGLENRCVSNGTGGSNPSPSAEPTASWALAAGAVRARGENSLE